MYCNDQVYSVDEGSCGIESCSIENISKASDIVSSDWVGTDNDMNTEAEQHRFRAEPAPQASGPVAASDVSKNIEITEKLKEPMDETSSNNHDSERSAIFGEYLSGMVALNVPVGCAERLLANKMMDDLQLGVSTVTTENVGTTLTTMNSVLMETGSVAAFMSISDLVKSTAIIGEPTSAMVSCAWYGHRR